MVIYFKHFNFFHFILFILMMVFSSHLSSQDTLYRKNGSKEIVKILKVDDYLVSYALWENLEGFKYTISKEQLTKIIFFKGETILIHDDLITVSSKNKKLDPFSKNFNRNFISVNIIDLLLNAYSSSLGALTVNYEFISRNGLLGVKFPFSFGLNKTKIPIYGNYSSPHRKNYYNSFKIFSSGIDFNYYPFLQGKSSYFLGASFEQGFFYYDPFFTKLKSNRKVGAFTSILFQNGFLFQQTRHFNISVHLALGIAQSRYYEAVNRYNLPSFLVSRIHTNPAYRIGFNLGYRF